jgi:hypothetical protein
MRFIGKLLLVVAWGFAIGACSPEVDIVANVKSPDGKVEAILGEINGGATTSFGYEISLRGVSPGQDPVRVARLYDAVRNESAYGVNLVWRNSQTLEVQYWKAENAETEHASISVGGQSITVRLKAGVLDKSAPAGGMDYNLHREKYRN